MSDRIDFRLTETLAIGHDRLNTIIYRKARDKRGSGVWFDGASWKPVRFVYMSKAVLLRDLRELGVAPACLEGRRVVSMPEDLREYRANPDAYQATLKTALEGV